MNPKLKGSTYIIISAIFFATYGIWSRLMSDDFSPFNQAWSRGLFLLIILLIYGLITKKFQSISNQDLKWFALIALAGGLNQAPYYYGFSHLTIGTATLLFYASLVIGGYILGAFVFKEAITKVKIISMILALVGMYAIFQFTLNTSQLFPAILTITAGLMGSMGVVLSKKLSGNYSETQILSTIVVSMFIANLILAQILHQPLPAISLSIPWLAWLAYAITLLIANAAVIAGFKYVSATFGSILGTLEIIFAIIFGIILFGETLTPSIILGSSILLLAILIPTASNHKKDWN